MRLEVRAPTSLGACVALLFPDSPGKRRKQMLTAGRVRVNGGVVRDPRTPLAAGDLVEVGGRRQRGPLPPGLSIVHEDADVLVVLKPAGLLTIATERERARTAYAYLTTYLRAERPGARVFVVHRLDKLASGLLAFAKSPTAKHLLQAQFAAHSVERVYVAVVEGRLGRREGVVESRLLDDAPGTVRETSRVGRGRVAVTRWRVLREGERFSTLEVRLETGRRNQIRVHLASLGHPVVGDAAYGSRGDPLGRLGLHACTLGFAHPRTGTSMRFEAPPPRSFARC